MGRWSFGQVTRKADGSLPLPLCNLATSFGAKHHLQNSIFTFNPITGFRDRIIGAELAETSEIKAIELEVKQSVDADVKKAKVIYSPELI